MIRRLLCSAVAILSFAAVSAQAQSPFARDYPTSYFPPSYPNYPYYTPREIAELSSPLYTNMWQPAYPLPPYQMSAWNYWYRTAYAPYMKATGYTLPARP
jgi:hypothetical protein